MTSTTISCETYVSWCHIQSICTEIRGQGLYFRPVPRKSTNTWSHILEALISLSRPSNDVMARLTLLGLAEGYKIKSMQ